MKPSSAISESEPNPPHVLLIAPHASYRIVPYIEAARQLGVRLTLASGGHLLPSDNNTHGIHLRRFDKSAHKELVAYARHHRVQGVIGTDDISVELAADLGKELALPHNRPGAARLTRRKDLARQALHKQGLPVPQFYILNLSQSLDHHICPIDFPAVIKPVSLSGSRGVIRVDNDHELRSAIRRVRAILEREELPEEEKSIVLVEQYIEGQEVAVEGFLSNGRLRIISVFDKPEPLTGPYFEESYYITPGKIGLEMEKALCDYLQQACRAYGLATGPVHAECRINDQGIWLLEMASRTIGGLCSRLFEYSVDQSLEEMVLQNALGKPIECRSMKGAAGVLMIPVPEAGVLRRVEGLSVARKLPLIEDVIIDVREGYELIPLPEGDSYLGFIFARGETGADVEQALRDAHNCLNIVTAPVWKAFVGQ